MQKFSFLDQFGFVQYQSKVWIAGSFKDVR
jgi:hypothetical protein